MNPYSLPILFVLSAFILGCGLTTYITSKQAINLHFNGIKAVGHVVELQTGTNSEGMSIEQPVIAYKDTSGTEHRILGSASSGPLSSPQPKVGDVAEVIYLARNPEKGVLNDWSELWLLPLVFGSFTLLFLMALLPALRGTMGSTTSDSRLDAELKESGVPAIATVLEANPEARILLYRIDKDSRNPTADLHGFEAAEQTLHDWRPSQAEELLGRGDQFWAYLDRESLKPGKTLRCYIDFSNRIGCNPRVQSMEEEEKE